ncbi:MAG: 30S ribosomal protein S6 [Candidatus Gracilibacteria bacterium]|nr:30S ribosomal protein S6 [Candidatus Gracilibacteria bacterium]
MKKYELMLIINPQLEESERVNLVTEIKSELEQAKVKILSEDVWGAKDLAYKIKNSKVGYYILYTLESTGDKFFDITKSFNIKKEIWRHIFIKLED